MDEVEQEGAREREERTEKQANPLRRLWGRLASVWLWVFNPSEVGQPVILRPRSVRLLILLVLGNLVVLIALTVALYRATQTQPLARPVREQFVVTPTPGPSPTPGPTPTPLGSGGAIAFTLRRNGNADVYALNQKDQQLVRLTYDPAEDRDPAWSPDGKYIAFASNRADNWDIYLLDLASGALIRLTHDPDFDANPSWSADDQWLAFESYRNGSLDIYVMSTTGKQLRRITTDRAPDYAPAWSPQGRGIAFTSFRDGNKDIYLHPMDDQEEVTNITHSPDLDEDSAAWSPDGSKLAYVSGPRGNPSIQVTSFNWDEMAADRTQTELFGAGSSPAWAPDGGSLLYTHERSERSHLVAASITGWASFHEVYSTEELLNDLAWSRLSLSPRVIARAQEDEPETEPPFYVEVAQPTPAKGPPYELVSLPGVEDEGESDREALLSDKVNESFNALRQRVVEEAGWDYLAELDSTWLPITHTPPSGHSRKSWHLCGRAIGLDQDPYESDDPRVELVREDVGNVTYWRVFLRAAKQDGSMGEPLRGASWDLNARQEGGRAEVEGGAPRERVPPGYYVDFTTLAGDYGWERIPALWRWRQFWPDIRWWEFRKTGDLNWWECMLEIFEPEKVETAFGPIPGYEE